MGIEQKQSKPISPISGAKWAPFVLLVLGLLILLLMGKGIAVLVADRIVYSIPILGGIARSLELAEFLNLVFFSALGMGIGLGVHWIPVPDQKRLGRSVLMGIIPILFLSSCFFQYQLWLSDVQADMGISAAQVRTVTNQWLTQTVKKQGLWGFYNYTTLYSILPTNPDRLTASIQGSDRVNELFSQVFSTTPARSGQLLGLCVWGLRAFYFGLSILTSLHHFEDGIAHRQQRLQAIQAKRKALRKLAQSPKKPPSRKVYKKVK
jgi:hypothetical protein